MMKEIVMVKVVFECLAGQEVHLPVSSEQRCGMSFIISYDDNGFLW